MKTKFMLCCLLVSLLLSCSSTKTAATPEQIVALDALIEEQAFTIKSDWAYPQTSSGLLALQNSGLLAPGDANASRFSLMGNPNFLKLSGETIDSYLPYFGERQVVTDRNGGGSIELEDIISDYEVEKQEDNSYMLKFKAKSNNESYTIVIEVFPNHKTEMIVRGSKRFPIRYTGQIEPILESL
ncbi:DUF4251 domain-containing protein [Psychroserpens sp. SPM9]|uniref:DUF4251 domain-containing protein n=1 Tax=Psychroserpens sp. SPM9 TaxID=2975598 RepID=UPI0021A6E9C2|nr:DUF4251 domain-containing protein [Psychroserpens sp. SPM9]MDG5491566.1 DUF4251 domain-containing protein [Psychroserpens sp. SPM9]